ncbi:helix-turn-helix transcriptional regulator [Microbispora sp. NPDC004025]
MSQDRARAARHVISRRGELGLTQQQLATRADVDIKTIYNLESGERWPQARNRFKIEQALGWAPGALDALAAGQKPGQRHTTLVALLHGARQRRGLSETEAATLAGLTEEQWDEFVAGPATTDDARKADTASWLARAARVLHITPDQLSMVGRTDAAEELARMLHGGAPEGRPSLEPWERKIHAIEELTEQERAAAVALIKALRGTATASREQGEGARRASGL